MLNAHPRIAIPFESDFIPKFYKQLAQYGDLTAKSNIERLLYDISTNRYVQRGGLIADAQSILARNPRTYSELITAIFRCYAEAHGKSRWGDKDPDNVLELDTLWSLFPGCKFVHIIRDGRAVACSLRKLDWGSKNIPKLAEDWRWRVTMAHKMGNMLGPAHYLEVRYEELVSSSRSQLEVICTFLGETFDERMLKYYEDAAEFLTRDSIGHLSKVTKPPDTKRAESWKEEMNSADAAIYEEIAGDALQLFGYSVVSMDSGWASRWISKLTKLKYAVITRW
jgi:hypothetical protein